METTGEQDDSLRGTLRRLGETLLTTVRNRVDLFGVELQEQRAWFFSTVIWVAAAIFLCVITVVMAVITIVWLSPESARAWILIGFTLLFACLTANAIIILRRRASSRPPPFDSTTTELKKDIQWIHSRD